MLAEGLTRDMAWVGAQAVLFILIIFLPLESQFNMPSWFSLLTQVLSGIGFLILIKAVYDLRRSLAISPVPNNNGHLQTNGIYSWIRHPMYLSVWLILGSGILRSGSYLKLFLFAALVIFFIFKVKYEEDLLKKKYQGYEKYMKHVGAFFPKNS